MLEKCSDYDENGEIRWGWGNDIGDNASELK